MQLQDMIVKVREEIGEPSVPAQIGTQVGSWSDAQIIAYINDAQGLLSRAARIQATPAVINMVVGTNTYPIPTNCIEDGLRKLVYTSSGTLYPVVDVGFDRIMEVQQDYKANQNASPSIGVVYGTWNGQINLYPTPQVAGDTLTVYFYQTLPDLVAMTDVSPIPARFHKALVKYAVAECQATAEESQLQMLAMQEFERLSMQLAQERSVETRDRPARVRLRR
jgi:hypothetical protein